MRKDKLAECCKMAVGEVKDRLGAWYKEDGDYILVPHEDRRQAGVALWGNAYRRQWDKDARTPKTPGRILCVGHLDTVLKVGWSKDAGGVFVAPALDDRIALYAFFWEMWGVECDVLLTDHEEEGRSTAQWFEAERDYNWIMQFDRRGTDVVMYQYDTAANRERLASVGARAGLGTFSDVAYLDGLGVAGFNWGTGYHEEHTTRCHLVVSEWETMLGLFLAFYGRYGSERIEHLGRYEQEDAWGVDVQWESEEDTCELCGMPVRGRLYLVSELRLWCCEDCVASDELNVEGAVEYGTCMYCGSWDELEEVREVGERLCPQCRRWWASV